MAEASIWIALVTLLSVFNICPAKDENGKNIIPPAEFETALTRYVYPFLIVPGEPGTNSEITSVIRSLSSARSDHGRNPRQP